MLTISPCRRQKHLLINAAGGHDRPTGRNFGLGSRRLGPNLILEFESATKGNNVFRDLVLARIIEPTSKIDAERVLTEVGVEPASYATVKRRLAAMPSHSGAKHWPRVQPMPAFGPTSLVFSASCIQLLLFPCEWDRFANPRACVYASATCVRVTTTCRSAQAALSLP